MTINERLRMVRVSLNMTQGEFGPEIDTAQNYLSQIENGARPVTPKISKIVCLKYGITEDWLLKGEGEMYKKMPAADDLIGRLASKYKMSAAEVSFLEAYLLLPQDKRAVLEALVDKAFDLRADRLRAVDRALADELYAGLHSNADLSDNA